MTELASNQEKEEFREIMKDDASARAYWKYHTFKLCELNKLNYDLIKAIDELCNNQEALDPFQMKRLIKKSRSEKARLARTVYFGKKALE